MSERLDQMETDVTEIKRSISELRSTVSTLADIVASHETLHEESRQRFDRFVEQADRDRALMLQLIQAILKVGTETNKLD